MTDILKRLTRLEAAHKGACVGVIEGTGKGVKAAWSGRTRLFDTVEAARDFLEDRVQVLIIDDIF